MNRLLFISVILALLTIACAKVDSPVETNSSGNTENNWLIDSEYLRLSPDAHDNIQSIDYPQFTTTYTALLSDNDIVYSYRYGNKVKMYPRHIIASHEIVNDNIDDHFYCISYCPLTGTAIAWDREINGHVTEFGVSGHLYHNNLIAYDRRSNDYWSQMYTLNINGQNSGYRLKWKHLVQTDWIIARNTFPGSLVLLPDSSHVCNDSICNVPGDIRQAANGITYGIANQRIDHATDKALLVQTPDNNNFTDLIEFSLGNKNGFVVRNLTHNVFTAFYYSYPEQTMTLSEKEVPITFYDEKGNIYDLTGFVLSGPDRGSRLDYPLAYGARMFAWNGFYGDGIMYLE